MSQRTHTLGFSPDADRAPALQCRGGPAQLRATRLPSAARLALVVPLLLLAMALAVQGGGAHAASAHRSAVTVAGVVVNATHGSAPVAGQQVTLQATGGNGPRDVATATTDGQGRFSFASAPVGDSEVLAVYTRFQQGFYSTPPLTPDGGSTPSVTLTVYDATTSDAALHVTSFTALLRDPRPRNGLVGVGEFFTFHNGGTSAFIGSTTPANGKPMGLLRFALPAGASNLTLGKGFVGAQAVQVPTGFGATATVPPGDSSFAFAFDVPYTGTACSFPVKAEYATDEALLLVPPGMTVDSQDFANQGQVATQGIQYQRFAHEALAAGATAGARFTGLPRAGEQPALDFGQLVALAAALALLLLGLVGLYLRRGDLAIVLRLVPGPTGRRARFPAVAEMTPAEREAERVRLLRKLLRLERARAAGQLSEAQMRRQARETRVALREVLALTEPAMRVPQVATAPGLTRSASSGAQPQAPQAHQAAAGEASAAEETTSMPRSAARNGGSR